MSYNKFLERSDLLIKCLAHCALSYKDTDFDKYSTQLDKLYSDYAGYYKMMISERK